MAGRKTSKVGYKQPPDANKFEKGKSGNPKGRPKGSKNFATRYQAELNAKIPVTENGKRKRVSKLDVIIKQQVTRGAAGDPKAVQQVLDRAVALEARERAGAPAGNFTDADREVIQAVYARLLGAEALNGDD
jgi:hypothetical protein